MHKYKKNEAALIAKEIKKGQGNDEEAIIKKGLENIKWILDQNTDYYLSFGPYWWLIKKLFATYLPGKGWYQSGIYNAVDTTKYGFDDDFLNYAVAIYYSNETNISNPSFHVLEVDDQKDDIQYSLYDPEAPGL